MKKTYQKHELNARSNIVTLRELFHSGEVYIHMSARLRCIEGVANSGHEPAQTLGFLLFGVVNVGKELLNALVHDTLRQHLRFEELSDELHKTETLTPGFLGGAVFVII